MFLYKFFNCLQLRRYSLVFEAYLPAIQAVKNPAMFPLKRALSATWEMSVFLLGATVVRAPMYIPMAAMLPNPQQAYVAKTFERSFGQNLTNSEMFYKVEMHSLSHSLTAISSCFVISTSLLNEMYSSTKTFVPNRLATLLASCISTPMITANGQKMTEQIVCKDEDTDIDRNTRRIML